jgi:hypothetical protein
MKELRELERAVAGALAFVKIAARYQVGPGLCLGQ